MADTNAVTCPTCGTRMTRHADKLCAEATRDSGVETDEVAYCCSQCGETVVKREPARSV